MSLCKCTGTAHYMKDNKFHLISGWWINLDYISSYNMLWYKFLADQSKGAIYGWQKRQTRGDLEIWTSHTTSSAHLQLYENLEAKNLLKIYDSL